LSKEKDKNGPQNTTQKIKDAVTRSPLAQGTVGVLTCFSSDTCHVTHVKYYLPSQIR